MDGLIEIAAVVGLLLVVGGVIGLTKRQDFSPGWLLAAAGLVLLNDFLLTRGHGVLPHLLPPTHWNWQGKALALAATLGIAALPAFGWKRCGLTLAQAPGSLMPCALVALAYCGVFAALALVFPDHSPASRETVAFQLTMPGFEEEPFYRGILLFALGQAFRGRVRLLGVEWGWGAVLSCLLFGLAHAFSYRHGQFALDPVTLGLTVLPSFLAVWVRLRSGSLVFPVLLHNFGNAASLIL